MESIAFFITPHGLGHAARSCAVINELQKILPKIKVLIFTTVPKEFFFDSLEGDFFYFSAVTDIGFVQKSSLEIDFFWTLEALKDYFPIDLKRQEPLIPVLERYNTKLIVSDISPLGIELSKTLNIESVLVENFTWDWIYGFYEGVCPKIRSIRELLAETYGSATYRVRAIPFCGESPWDLIAPPVSRRPKTSPAEIRARLQMEQGHRMLMVTMGGVSEELGFIDNKFKEFLESRRIFLVCPSDVVYIRREKNILYLPKFSNFYHPDLINASDGVLGKLGYGTIGEIANSGVPFAFVLRESYPETEHMKEYALSLGNTAPVTSEEFYKGNIMDKIDLLFTLNRRTPETRNGAEVIAEFISKLV